MKINVVNVGLMDYSQALKIQEVKYSVTRKTIGQKMRLQQLTNMELSTVMIQKLIV